MATDSDSSSPNPADREIVSRRVFAAAREAVFSAFSEPQQLAQWWGPEDFTNTIQEFDLRPGGRWRMIMHGPNGTEFHNEKVFVEVVPNERVVFDHLQPMHHFRMTLLLLDREGHTELTWKMLFDTAAEVSRLRKFIALANEQNFDRLAAHLAQRGRG